jgi:hypothetical protein
MTYNWSLLLLKSGTIDRTINYLKEAGLETAVFDGVGGGSIFGYKFPRSGGDG